MPEERWKLIPITGAEAYEASDRGRIRSRKLAGPPRVLSPRVSPDGYYQVVLSLTGMGQRVFTVASLVLLAHVGARPTPKHHASYLNCDHGDNRLANLEWSTKRRRKRA